MKIGSIRMLGLVACGLPIAACAQVPDLVNAFDAGGSAMGMGSAGTVLGADTQTPFYNPAGLGYARRKQVGVAVRNLPKSRTVATGDLVPSGSERLASTGDRGPTSFTHGGVIIPLGPDGKGGAIGFSVTTGGVIRDERGAGPGLNEGGLPAPDFYQRLENRTQFLTIAYGRSAMGGSLNWGAGLVYAMNQQSLDRAAPSGTTSFSESPNGIGAILGLQFNPPSMMNWSFGASYRTPIKLEADGAPLIYDEIPGRLSAGAAYRIDGIRRGTDYLVLAGQVDHYFAAGKSLFFEREAQTVVGVGAEYSYQMGGARIPLRLGYTAIPSAGRGFGSRNTLSFGLGYRPQGESWGVDLGFGRPSGGGGDFGLSMFYRFGK